MSTIMRHSAAAASVIVISAAIGFGLGATMLSAKDAAEIEIGKGPGVDSPGSSRENSETRSISGFKAVVLRYRNISLVAYPAMNPEGPVPGESHARPGATRSIASACLMAMN